jgi:hypothetical protein
MLSVGDDNASYGVFNLGLGSGTPSIIPVNIGCYDSNFTGYTTFPIKVAPAIPIQIQLWSLNSSALTSNITLIPIPAGVLDPCSAIQSMGPSTSSNYTTIGTTQTLFGTTLAIPAKRIVFVGGNMVTANSFGSINIGFGLSTSAVNPLINNIGIGSGSSYVSNSTEFPIGVPPSQNIYLIANGGYTNARGSLYLFY